MPRTSRVYSSSCYQHLIIRGIGKQVLFEEPADNHFFISQLKRVSAELNISVHAYCLMENHVHLLIHDPDGTMAGLMHRVCQCYAEYYNRKYSRTGHLFQDRYKNEPIECDAAYLAVFRYILRNPEKAGICKTADYPWNSFHAYYTRMYPYDFIDLSVARDLIGSISAYEQFILEPPLCGEEYEGTEYEPKRHDDDWARAIIREKLKVTSGTALQDFTRTERNQAISLLKKEGLSVRQIERLTGIPRGVIQYTISR